MQGVTSWLARYNSGDTERVWAEMLARGAAIREGALFEDAMAVARETMRRVRWNTVTVHGRLRDLGYAFEQPERATVSPGFGVVVAIREIETTLGPLPLSLRAFYEIVGAIDFRQSFKQLVNFYEREERTDVPEVLFLGEADPLVVHPIEEIIDELTARPKKLHFCFAPDEFHKANYSGGENYHVNLPEPAADAPILGMYGVAETFVEHLRYCFRFGGFRGHIECEPQGEKGWKIPPRVRIAQALAEGLLPL
jgi:hypothetical protein